MLDPIVTHSFVQVNSSFIHLVQYASQPGSLLKFPVTNKHQLSSSYRANASSSSSFSTQSAHSTSSYLSTTSSINTSNLSPDTSRSSIATGSLQQSPPQPSRQVADDVVKKVIIFVPGNPGILGVYHDFLVALYRTLSGSSSKFNGPTILAISHNNFDHPDHVNYRTEERFYLDESDLNFAERAQSKNYRHDPHHIELQVLNKLIILKRMLKVNHGDCKMVYVGHSIGCYVILRLLQDKLLASCHAGSIMLHPALENLALTSKGSACNRLFHYKLDMILRALALLVDKLLPKPAKLALTSWASPEFVKHSSDIAVESLMQLACHKTLHALIQMAKSELALVKDINPEKMIKPHVPKLKLIYAIDDHWVNAENRARLMELYPELHIEEQRALHAFIMDPQLVMHYAIKVGMFTHDLMASVD